MYRRIDKLLPKKYYLFGGSLKKT